MKSNVRTILVASAVILYAGVLAAALPQPNFRAFRLPPPGTPVLAGQFTLPGTYRELTVNEGGIRGIFDAGGEQVLFETRRGPRITQGNTDQFFEIDVRLMDKNGVTYFMQFGGHGPIDTSWALDNSQAGVFEESVAEQARASFVASVQALETLRTLKFRRSLTPEYKALTGLIPLLQSMLAAELVENPEQANQTKAGTCLIKNKITVYQAPCCEWVTVPGSRHASTLAQNISLNGTPVSAWSACNHGRCPGESGMTVKCSWTSSANRCVVANPLLCPTLYGILLCGTHTCNDDTKIQYDQIRYNAVPSMATCFDCTTRFVPDSCY